MSPFTKHIDFLKLKHPFSIYFRKDNAMMSNGYHCKAMHSFKYCPIKTWPCPYVYLDNTELNGRHVCARQSFCFADPVSYLLHCEPNSSVY